jgi:hypothetical protein
MAEEVVKECCGMGGTLEAIGQVIEACLSREILKAKCVRPHYVSFYITVSFTYILML